MYMHSTCTCTARAYLARDASADCGEVGGGGSGRGSAPTLQSPPIETLALVAKTAAIERPGRVSVGTGQHTGEGWLGVESAMWWRCGSLYAYEGAVKWL